MMSGLKLRLIIAGVISGIGAGIIFSLAIQFQGMMNIAPALLGVMMTGYGLILHLLFAAMAGAVFAAVYGFQAGRFAASISGGLMYGLLLWILGPLSLHPWLQGRSPTWSLLDAGQTFTSLMAHLMFGGLTALGFHLLMTFYFSRFPEVGLPIETKPKKKQIVILGGGFGGISTAQRLEQIFPGSINVEITLVSQSNYLLFTPMLAEVASSSLEAQHISAPIRAACPYTKFQRAEIEEIDTESQVIHLRMSPVSESNTLPYDHLVLALGSVPNFFALPGVEEYAFTLKTLHDATLLRNHLISTLESADVEEEGEVRRRQLTFVVAGGGFAGTEMIAEIFDLIHSILRYYPRIPRDDLRFILIHSRERILPEISAELADFALRKLTARGIEFRLGVRVTGATAHEVKLDDGTEIPTHTLVWTAGNQPNPLLANLPCLHNQRGAVITKSTLQIDGLKNVWAVGDCAQIPDLLNEGQNCPPTAQHALREGKVVAENISALLQNKPVKSFRFRTIGTLVALGHRTGVAEIRGWQFSGLLAWVLWRGVYLSKLPGLEKKVRVALDWLLDLLFPRDIVLTLNVTPTLSDTIFGKGDLT